MSVNENGRRSRAFDVRVESTHRYAVEFEPGSLDAYGTRFAARFPGRQPVVITDRRVDRLYGERLRASFAAADIEPSVFAVDEGEGSKSLATFEYLLGAFADAGVARRTIVVNFGGGVICDLGGFVASAYLRGIDYANFSTSLIGQLDASVGGKVAVNAPFAKNFIGAFHHPVHVGGDPTLLATLSDRDFRSGIAEAIKVAIIACPALFAFLETERDRLRARDPGALVHLVGESARLKMAMIDQDPYERDLRRPLNLGHTIGHPVETTFEYEGIRHGEAVAVGMGVATCIARRQRVIDEPAAERVLGLLAAYDLLGFHETLDPTTIVERMRYVRLVRANALHFVLPAAIGEVVITDALSDADIVRGFEDLDAEARCGRA